MLAPHCTTPDELGWSFTSRRTWSSRWDQATARGLTDEEVYLVGIGRDFYDCDGRDLHLSPRNDPTRVFCLCWHHHHGCFDQGYITTVGLLKAEET
jgi:hypothetical protein